MYQPKYTITNTILKNVSLIEAAREVVENAALVPAWEAQFRRDAIVRTVHYGTHLEGNPLSREQVEAVVVGELPEHAAPGVIARERDIQEVLNYREVLKYIDGLGLMSDPKTARAAYRQQQLEEIHRLVTRRILPESEQGKLRTVQVVIRDKATGAIIYRPPVAPAVRVQIQEFFDWINSSESRANDHPIVRAGITHWELVRIHPFTDGNGRTARAMTLLVLFREGYDVKRFFSIEQYYDQNPREYYEALQSSGAIRSGDVTEWLEYFTQGLVIELSRVKDRVLQLSRDLKLKGKLGRQVSLSERQILILEVLEANRGQATARTLSKHLRMISRDTILRDLNDLLEKGVIRKAGKTKGSMYLLDK